LSATNFTEKGLFVYLSSFLEIAIEIPDSRWAFLAFDRRAIAC
jgi:hypothetical protein